MTTYQIVEYSIYRLEIELVGRHPEAEWLQGWLRDLIHTNPKALPRNSVDAALWIAERVKEQWNGQRAFVVEVRRNDKQGATRVVEKATPKAVLH